MKTVKDSAKIRVMIVDDHPRMREALRQILDLEPDIVVAAEAKSGEGAIHCLLSSNPDVVLMDASMPQMTGIEATRRLRELRSDVKVIGLTLYDQTSYLEEMIASGARGYVLKTGGPSEIIKAIRTVAAGGTHFDASIPRRGSEPHDRRVPIGRLTSDELAVAKRLANGQTGTEIAAALSLTLSAVNGHRVATMSKLGLRNRAELVRVAKERGWLGR